MGNTTAGKGAGKRERQAGEKDAGADAEGYGPVHGRKWLVRVVLASW